jgi:hypothetical protein
VAPKENKGRETDGGDPAAAASLITVPVVATAPAFWHQKKTRAAKPTGAIATRIGTPSEFCAATQPSQATAGDSYACN